MQTINYNALPPEVATFRDYLTMAVKFPNRFAMMAQLRYDLSLLEEFLAENRGPKTYHLTDYYTRTVAVLHFVECYVKDDGEPDGFIGLN